MDGSRKTENWSCSPHQDCRERFTILEKVIYNLSQDVLELRHRLLKQETMQNVIICPLERCGATFTRPDRLAHHIRAIQDAEHDDAAAVLDRRECRICKKDLPEKAAAAHERSCFESHGKVYITRLESLNRSYAAEGGGASKLGSLAEVPLSSTSPPSE